MQDTQPTPTGSDNQLRNPVIKVLGLGGGGGNAVDRMIEFGIPGIEFIAANTDYQVLQKSQAPTKIQLGPLLTRGLGAGGDYEIGCSAAQESRKELEDALRGADMVFLAAGMGGGTGTGSIAVAGEVARALGAVTIAVVTTPFSFEMGRRQRNAYEGLERLKPHTDTLITIANDRLLQVAPQDLPLETAFRMADDVLRRAVQGIAELITQPGLMNVDFSHIRNMMLRGGGALLAIGYGSGPNKVLDAIQQALQHPLLGDVSLADADGVIANFSGGDDLSLYEVGEAVGHINAMTGSGVDVVMGLSQDERLNGRAQVILVVTGLGQEHQNSQPQQPEAEHTESFVSQEEALELEAAPPQQTPAQPDAAFAKATFSGNSEPSMPAEVLSDLDVPAFLRKKARVNAQLILE